MKFARILSICAVSGALLAMAAPASGSDLTDQHAKSPRLGFYDFALLDSAAPEVFERGYAAFARANYAQAAKMFELSIHQGIATRESFIYAGLSNLGAGDAERAKYWFGRAKSRVGANIAAEHGMALSHIALGESDHARAILSDLNDQLLRSHSAERQRQLKGAIASIDRALK